MRLSTFIKKLRKERGWSLREASRRVGISHSYLDNLEKGVDPRTGKPVSPTLDTLRRLATGFAVDERLLLTRAGVLDPRHMDKQSVEIRQIPLLSQATLAAPFLREVTRTRSTAAPPGTDCDFALAVSNDILYCAWAGKRPPKPGNLVVAECDGRIQVRWLLATTHGRPFLRGDRPDEMDMPVNHRDGRILAVVVARASYNPRYPGHEGAYDNTNATTTEESWLLHETPKTTGHSGGKPRQNNEN